MGLSHSLQTLSVLPAVRHHTATLRPHDLQSQQLPVITQTDRYTRTCYCHALTICIICFRADRGQCPYDTLHSTWYSNTDHIDVQPTQTVTEGNRSQLPARLDTRTACRQSQLDWSSRQLHCKPCKICLALNSTGMSLAMGDSSLESQSWHLLH
jgi:hypothetical protein